MTELKRRDHFDDKWPRLIVDGKSVTADQAEQILIRTNGWYLHCNDPQWEEGARKILGMVDMFAEMDHSRRDEPGYISSLIDESDRAMDALGVLRLQYLDNNRIATSYFGGVHGWCNWNGRIGCADYNIGKWPSVDEITMDWKRIARAFPFLSLRCQVVSMLYDDQYHEYPITMGRVWGTWRIRGGKVLFDSDNTDFMGFPEGVKTEATMGDFLLATTGGQHLTLEALAAIVERVKRTLPKPERLAIDG